MENAPTMAFSWLKAANRGLLLDYTNLRVDLRLNLYPGHGAAQRGAAAEERGEPGQGEEVHREGGRRGPDLHHHGQELGGAGGHQLARSAAAR